MTEKNFLPYLANVIYKKKNWLMGSTEEYWQRLWVMSYRITKINLLKLVLLFLYWKLHDLKYSVFKHTELQHYYLQHYYLHYRTLQSLIFILFLGNNKKIWKLLNLKFNVILFTLLEIYNVVSWCASQKYSYYISHYNILIMIYFRS